MSIVISRSPRQLVLNHCAPVRAFPHGVVSIPPGKAKPLAGYCVRICSSLRSNRPLSRSLSLPLSLSLFLSPSPLSVFSFVLPLAVFSFVVFAVLFPLRDEL